MNQHLIDILQFCWSTFHDGLYVGLFLLFQRLGFVKQKKDVHRIIEARLATLETLHKKELEHGSGPA